MTIIQHARKHGSKEPFGTFVATQDEHGNVYFGYSARHPKKEDFFSKKRGVEVATGRAEKRLYIDMNEIPMRLLPYLEKFKERCLKAFGKEFNNFV